MLSSIPAAATSAGTSVAARTRSAVAAAGVGVGVVGSLEQRRQRHTIDADAGDPAKGEIVADAGLESDRGVADHTETGAGEEPGVLVVDGRRRRRPGCALDARGPSDRSVPGVDECRDRLGRCRVGMDEPHRRAPSTQQIRRQVRPAQ
jgi:hypothetical protein